MYVIGSLKFSYLVDFINGSRIVNPSLCQITIHLIPAIQFIFFPYQYFSL